MAILVELAIQHAVSTGYFPKSWLKSLDNVDPDKLHFFSAVVPGLNGLGTKRRNSQPRLKILCQTVVRNNHRFHLIQQFDESGVDASG